MNRSMEAKHAKAKKWAIKESQEREHAKACATKVVPQHKSVVWNINYRTMLLK